MAKKIKGFIKLLIAPGSANPSPPVGPALGQQGVNIMEFCKKFNDMTKGMESDLKVTTQITVFEDRSFTFTINQPIVSGLILKAIGVAKGSAMPNRNKIGQLTQSQIVEIAKRKWPDLTAADLEAAIRTVAGTARSMGVDVEEKK